MEMASALLEADGFIVVREVGGAFDVSASRGIDVVLHESLLDVVRGTGQSAPPCDGKVVLGAVTRGGHLLVMRLPADGDARWHCAFLRQAGDRPFREREIEMLACSLPGLAGLLGREQHALRGGVAEGNAVAAQAGAWLLDQLDAEFCVVDRDLRLVLANGLRSAQARIELPGRRLQIGAPADRLALQTAVTRVLAEAGVASAVEGVALGSADQRRYALVAPMDVTLSGGARRLAAILVLRHVGQSVSEDVIRTMFGLTRVESRVVALLTAGVAPNEAAAQLRLRPNTLKQYMKNIFRALDVHRQADLARLVHGTAGLLRAAHRPLERRMVATQPTVPCDEPGATLGRGGA